MAKAKKNNPEYNKEYNSRPEVREHRHQYLASPETRERLRRYNIGR